MNYLYNGEELPQLPEVEGYGYAAIDDDGEGGTLILFSDIGYYVPDVSASSTVNPAIRGGGACRVYYNNGNGVWEYQYEITNGADTYVTNVFWANFDLCYEDGTSYLAASDPIPVNPAPTLDPTALLMGWQVGNRIRQRGGA